MKIVFGIIGLTTFILFGLKLLIQLSLDRRNNHTVNMSFYPMFLWLYFLYEREVAPEDERLKKLCNRIYRLALRLFVLDLIILLFLNFLDPNVLKDLRAINNYELFETV